MSEQIEVAMGYIVLGFTTIAMLGCLVLGYLVLR